jgi:hypothetical protein
MRRRFFNAADNFVGGCYNKLSNEDIKRLGGKRPYVCQFNKIHIHIGPVLKDHDSDVSYIMFDSNWNYGGYESMVYHHSNIGNIEDHIQDLTYWYEYDPSINENYCYFYYEANNSGNAIKLNGEFGSTSTVFNIPSLEVTTLRDGSLSFPEIYIEGVWDPSLYKSVL